MRTEGTAEEYQEQLIFTDKLLGEWLTRMKTHDLYDRSMIILTSDHSWRDDPKADLKEDRDRIKSVPLIVKLPYSKQSHRVDTKFETTKLSKILNLAISGNANWLALERALKP
jgi:arylsulfatase A-like enzyme